MTDWHAWYSQYDDPDSSLARRLAVVRRRIRETLAVRSSDQASRILSLCAGDGRDLLPELPALSAPVDSAVLVEKDDLLASRAVATANEFGLVGVRVIVGDAGLSSTFIDHVPVDLLLLCGIFGNVSEHDIRATVAATPGMLSPGGSVIWTRGASEPDLRPVVRAWFKDAGLLEVTFDAESEGFGVGVARIRSNSKLPPAGLPDRLFTFVR